jgi:hypothetical protein
MAWEVYEAVERDSNQLKIMGWIFTALFLVAAPGILLWPVALGFLVLAGLGFAVIVRARLSWPVRLIFLAILALALLLQGATRGIQAQIRDCDSDGRKAHGSVPNLGAALQGLNPFKYSGCYGGEHNSD